VLKDRLVLKGSKDAIYSPYLQENNIFLYEIHFHCDKRQFSVEEI